jgi:2-amino-4-hydroxy-6-hydroxymethyldihydropteridine diphosphokinase
MTDAYLGLGSNLGNRRANLEMAIRALTRLARVTAVSSLYETAPVGPPQPPFYNAAAAIETGLPPGSLLRFVKGIEEEIGRRPGPIGGSRPIDIDILLYGDATIDEDGLTIPHPRLTERAFVLVPLAEIAPNIVHPASGTTIAELSAGTDDAGVTEVSGPGWDGVAGGPPQRVRI